MAEILPESELRSLHAQGWSTTDIAEKYGINRCSLGRRMRKLGLAQNRPLRKPALEQVDAERRQRGALSTWAGRLGLEGDEAAAFVESEVSKRGKKSVIERDAATYSEELLSEPMRSFCSRCGYEVSGTARETIRRMRTHLDGCGRLLEDARTAPSCADGPTSTARRRGGSRASRAGGYRLQGSLAVSRGGTSCR